MKYQKLEKTVKVKGVGIPTLTATLIERTEKKALYKREDNVFEVFLIKTQEECEIFGKKYPAKELYPNNEDFGKIAWCFNNYEIALNRYKKL